MKLRKEKGLYPNGSHSHRRLPKIAGLNFCRWGGIMTLQKILKDFFDFRDHYKKFTRNM